MKLIKLLLFKRLKANLFAPSACGLIQNFLRTQLSPRARVGKHCSGGTKLS